MASNERKLTAIVLAGGKSERMKENKALLRIGNQTLIERVLENIEPYFHEILISAQSQQTFEFLPYPVIPDREPGIGPMMGILSSLKASSNEVNFVIGCDIPDIDVNFLKKMAGYTWDFQLVVPLAGRNHYEPLFAFYNKSVISNIEKLLAQNQRKVINLFHICRTKLIAFENTGWYRNINSIEEYRSYLAALARRGSI